ncbi:hypothetical protein BDY19DRAFT_908518 [Irpex rosettiformis]|uniref:Uncharacterized protein n=1 Tax=Irpex rosettiformis TaxID=378272 RepID=A0ACB8TWA7_9APHY|nr:hypothetical protein BDY19DRAFT_908518 [Irpex rosettiformis]
MPNPSGKNGFKESPPDAQLQVVIEHYVTRGFSNPDISKKLRRHFDPDTYALSVSLIKKNTRGQAHTLESIGLAIEDIRSRFPSMGSRLMKVKLLREKGMGVSKKLILEYMNLNYPDQHDKWRKFQLFLHVGIEPHSGLILWLKIWWTNRNPRLVCSWYLDTIEALGYVMPLLTQSDPGTENYGIANAQTVLRHFQDPSLADTLQHKFRGFENFLAEGVNAGLYDPDKPLERLVFHYVFIPWLQSELDVYRTEANDTRPRFNRNKVLPHGRPTEIFEHPGEYDTMDFGVRIDKTHVDEVREQYAPPDHEVFRLVPPAFELRARQFYSIHGKPEASRENIWQIYLTLLEHFESIQEEEDMLTVIQEQTGMAAVGEDTEGEEYMALLPLKAYRVNLNGPGARQNVVARGVPSSYGREDSDSELIHNEFTDASSEGSSVESFEGDSVESSVD